jgi:hypothetical protein
MSRHCNSVFEYQLESSLIAHVPSDFLYSSLARISLSHFLGSTVMHRLERLLDDLTDPVTKELIRVPTQGDREDFEARWRKLEYAFHS